MGYNSAEDLVSGSQTPQVQIARLAEVTSLDSKGRAKVTFYGEDTEARKTYNYIDGYIPEVGDKVLMLGQGNTFIIVGAVEAEEVIVKYSLKDHTHDYADKEHEHDALTNGKKTLTVTSSGEVVPGADSSYSLGTSAASFAKGYIDEVVLSKVTVGGVTYDDADICQRLYDASNLSYYVAMNNKNLIPAGNGTLGLGTSTRQFSKVYAQNVYVNGTAVSTSDKRKKKYIKSLAGKYTELFKKLRPVTFKYKDGTSGRAHAGFIAQEVEQAMQECGITNEEFGGLVIQDNGEYGLRYEEFIALHTAVIQDLQKKVEELERRVNNDRV